jgi:phosphatidylinositol alpha-1,6-mannosyltransferase
MHVLALVTDAFGEGGGIAQYNRDLIRALAPSTVVVLPRRGSAAKGELPAGVCQLPPRSGRLRYALAAAGAAVTKGPFDAVFCGHLYMVPLAAVLSRLLSVPLWLQLHGYEAWGGMSRIKRRAAGCATLITAVSRYTRRRFLDATDLAPWRVKVLPNTFGDRFLPGVKPAHLIDRHELRGHRVLLTVGRLAANEGRKGHDRIIRALPQILRICPDICYLIVGDGDDRARLKMLARQSGVADEVLFAGMVPDHELADYYRLADAFVMPSSQEGFGIVFLEAAACGVRLIGGRDDGSTDPLADGAIGHPIDPADPHALADAVALALAGRGPDPLGAGRFAFANFSRHVAELMRLLGAAHRRAGATP